jgi:hypothetical protein
MFSSPGNPLAIGPQVVEEPKPVSPSRARILEAARGTFRFGECEQASSRSSASSSARTPVSPQPRGVLEGVGGVSGFLVSTAQSQLPPPPPVHDNHVLGALEARSSAGSGGVLGYLAKLEAEAKVRDAQSSSHRRHSERSDSLNNLSSFIMEGGPNHTHTPGRPFAAPSKDADDFKEPRGGPRGGALLPHALQTFPNLGDFMSTSGKEPAHSLVRRGLDPDRIGAESPARKGGPKSTNLPAQGEQSASAISRSEQAHAMQSSIGAHAGVSADGGVETSTSPRPLSSMGQTSATAMALSASSRLPMDAGRLGRLRELVRAALPSDATAAAVTLRRRLATFDGDKDGVLGDGELLRALVRLAPASTAADIGFLSRHLRSLEGSDSGSSVSSLTKFVLGGRAAVAGSRLEWASPETKFQAFRNEWEGRHGAAATRELASDAAVAPGGPTWTHAQPAPFVVLRLSAGSPAPGRG